MSKSKVRYEAAANEQRFLYHQLSRNFTADEWVNSNVPKVSALLNLTARICGFLLNVKSKVMDEKQKQQLIEKAEQIEAIENFFEDWSVEDCNKTSANSSIIIFDLIQGNLLNPQERNVLRNLVSQHLCMLECMEPFAKKGGEQ